MDYTEERRDQTRILEVKPPNIDGLDQMKTITICRVAAKRLTLVHCKSVNI